MSSLEFNREMLYTIAFSRSGDPEPIGVLDLSGPEMTFKGCADSSAKIFFDALLGNFQAAWRQEFEETRRRLERELAAAIEQRDEARREVCNLRYTPSEDNNNIWYAETRGWDCFAQQDGGGA